MAAWKTLLWEGELTAGQTVLVLGATGTSGRIATQLAKRHGARVIAAGRNQRVLVQLLARGAAPAGDGPQRIRYIQVGIAAGEVAALPAITMRSAPVQLFGSGIGGPAALGDATAAYKSLLEQVAAGDISLDIDRVPLAKVEQAWPRAGSDRRIVFVP
jgi:NAD(P)-dependent dehydrogenase (short-subunit alcohol dehydrogenase family)